MSATTVTAAKARANDDAIAAAATLATAVRRQPVLTGWKADLVQYKYLHYFKRDHLTWKVGVDKAMSAWMMDVCSINKGLPSPLNIF
jgi:hypothetical protein